MRTVPIINLSLLSSENIADLSDSMRNVKRTKPNKRVETISLWWGGRGTAPTLIPSPEHTIWHRRN